MPADRDAGTPPAPPPAGEAVPVGPAAPAVLGAGIAPVPASRAATEGAGRGTTVTGGVAHTLAALPRSSRTARESAPSAAPAAGRAAAAVLTGARTVPAPTGSIAPAANDVGALVATPREVARTQRARVGPAVLPAFGAGRTGAAGAAPDGVRRTALGPGRASPACGVSRSVMAVPPRCADAPHALWRCAG
ncbi:hypothetical protein ACFYRN_14455 [Streptomyces sp. NPDC005227]|uniref:hypothetical protein n=1 Tax=Streptomyces sp. NPDC005227 TaxID=3364707 RepID=UPI0036B199A2